MYHEDVNPAMSVPPPVSPLHLSLSPPSLSPPLRSSPAVRASSPLWQRENCGGGPGAAVGGSTVPSAAALPAGPLAIAALPVGVPLAPASGCPADPCPLASVAVAAGFPSPADDYVESRIDLNLDLDDRARVTVLAGIGQQILEDLHQPHPIGQQGHRLIGGIRHQGLTARDQQGLGGLDRLS